MDHFSTQSLVNRLNENVAAILDFVVPAALPGDESTVVWYDGSKRNQFALVSHLHDGNSVRDPYRF